MRQFSYRVSQNGEGGTVESIITYLALIGVRVKSHRFGKD